MSHSGQHGSFSVLTPPTESDEMRVPLLPVHSASVLTEVVTPSGLRSPQASFLPRTVQGSDTAHVSAQSGATAAMDGPISAPVASATKSSQSLPLLATRAVSSMPDVDVIPATPPSRSLASSSPSPPMVGPQSAMFSILAAPQPTGVGLILPGPAVQPSTGHPNRQSALSSTSSSAGERASDGGDNRAMDGSGKRSEPHLSIAIPTYYRLMGDAGSVGPDAVGINWLKLEEHLEGIRSHARQQTVTHLAVDATSSSVYTFYTPETGPIVAGEFSKLRRGPATSDEAPIGDGWADLFSLRSFWLDVRAPAAHDLKVLASIFNIHPLTTEDIMTETTREKLEVHRNYYFIAYCSFDQNPASFTYLQSFNVYILVYNDFILSFHALPLPTLPDIYRRLENWKTYLQVSPHWISYALLDDITDKFFPLVRSIEFEVESIDDLVLVISHSEQSDMLRRIANARRRVMSLQRLLGSKADVLRMLIKRLEGISGVTNNSLMGNSQYGAQLKSQSVQLDAWSAMIKDTSLYLGDVHDHVITLTQILGHVDTTLTRGHSNYLAQINIEITQSSNKSNDSMTKLTALAAIMLPLNLITGMMGMNVHVPGMVGFTDDPNYAWFIGILLTMVSIVIIGLFIMSRLGILKLTLCRK